MFNSAYRRRVAGSFVALAAGLISGPALAQRAGENVVTAAADAFGTQVGQEKIGIYSDQDVRGFSPVRAGNLRIGGMYFDQQVGLTGRARAGSRIRVGLAAVDYPFPAPSGIVEYRMRSSGDEAALNITALRTDYGGKNIEVDGSFPIIKGHVSLATGVTRNAQEFVDGAGIVFYGFGFLPRFRYEAGETNLMLSYLAQRGVMSRVIVSAPGAFLPPFPAVRKYLGQDWAVGAAENVNIGGFGHATISSAWSARYGGFLSRQVKHYGYSEIFSVADRAGNATHRVIADPRTVSRSYSGEAELAWRHDAGDFRHRVLFNLRGRDKRVESGGSDSRNLGPVVLGQLDPEPMPAFVFRATDDAEIRQKTFGLGYVGRYRTLAQVNLGLQKTDYDATFHRQGLETRTRTRPWLYNATLTLSPSPRWLVYAGTVSGLEESGTAPEDALNRLEALPAARTRQYDGGVRVKLWTTQLVVSAFQIEKPYFSFDQSNRFDVLGDVRHRGLEASIAGPIGPLTLLAGGLLMKPEVIGEARALGRVGARPVGVAATVFRIDADYRMPIEGLSLTAAALHTGRRAASARTYAELGGKQLFTPPSTTIDLGARYRFKLQDRPMSARLILSNIFDNRSWNVVSSNSYQLDDARRLTMNLSVDF